MVTDFKLNDFAGKNVAIHCKTRESANAVIKILSDWGCSNMDKNNYWDSFKSDTVYSIDDNNTITFWDKKTASEEGFFILPAILSLSKYE